MTFSDRSTAHLPQLSRNITYRKSGILFTSDFLNGISCYAHMIDLTCYYKCCFLAFKQLT